MERTNIVVIAVVVAALALFGLRFFSGGADPVDLASLSAPDRLGSSGMNADLTGGAEGPGGSVAGGRSRMGGFGSSGTRSALGPGRGSNGGSGGGGAADVAHAAGARGGGSVGTSGSAGGSSGWGSSASIAGGDQAGRAAPLAQRRDNLVESLGSRQPIRGDLTSQPVDRGDDVALQINSTQDIADQGGYAEGEVRDDGQGIEFTENSRVEFPNAGNASKEGSITFTIKPDWAGGDPTNNALVQIRQEHEWNNRLEIVKNGEFLRFIVTDNTGKETDISHRIIDWQPGEEQIVTASWGKDESGQGRTELSINNQIVGRNEYSGEVEFRPGTPMIFGADHPGSTYSPAQAQINNFTVGKTPLFTQ